LWSLSASSYDSESFEVSSQSIQPLVEKVVTLMQSSTDPIPLLRGEVPLDHVVSQAMQPLVEKVVTSMQSSIDPTPLLRGAVPLDHVVSQPIQPLAKKVVMSMHSSANVITLNCTTHAYLASGQLISLLCQNSAEQLFENPLVSRPTCPNPLLHACAHWLAHYSPRVPNKARKKEIFRRNKKLWLS
jgi:hypothetical protein